MQLLDFQKVMQENHDNRSGREIDFDFVKGLDEAEEKILVEKHELIVLGDHFSQNALIQFRERLLSVKIFFENPFRSKGGTLAACISGAGQILTFIDPPEVNISPTRSLKYRSRRVKSSFS